MNFEKPIEFLRDRSGATVMLVGIALPMMVVAMGMGVDVSRAISARTALQLTLDAALISGATRLDDAAKATSIATAHFDATAKAFSGVTRTIVAKDAALTGTASATVETTLMRIAGVQSMPVSVKASASGSSKGLELVMVLDVSGSMTPNIASLREAASELVAVIYGSSTSLPNTFVGIAPFGGRVNIIDYGSSWMTAAPKQANGPTSSVGTSCKVKKADTKYPKLCAAHRAKPNSENDAPPSAETFVEFSGDAEVCPVNKAVGLTSTRATVDAAIDQLCAGHGTSTEVGMVWGWRMISPKWKGLWGDPKLPLSATETPGKYVVIMTDGQNHPDQSGDAYSATQADEQLIRECTAMKQQGVTIFAVTFNMKGALTDLYDRCVTKTEYNLTAESGAELKNAFSQIGGEVSRGQIRLIY